ncbi:MAG: CBS domain-containing protein [Candidatus Omnitrophota bacterium]
MDLIVTHKSADFDGLSSMVAVSKLYPGARLLLPGSQEKAVRNFLSLIKDKFRIENEKTCRLDDVNRLIIVDNRHRSRIGIAASLLGRKSVQVHIYDHHPRTDFDIKADIDVYKEAGATVTLILEILQAKGKFDLDPLEATLMLLGIYEETGSLSYAPTTKLDVDMVSRLLTKGANLNAVSSYLNRELSGKELSIFISLLESTEVVSVNGVEVAFCSVSGGHFEGEMGTVVHKLQDVDNYPVLFVLFQSGDRVKIMARSRENFIDVNKLMRHFNGAGHASAASAKITGASPAEVKARITRLLENIIHSDVRAQDIMSYPVNTVSQDEKVTEVIDKLRRFENKGAPVLNEDSEAVGMITLGDLKKAIKHKMGHSRVKGYMSRPLVTVSPGTEIHLLKNILFEKDFGRIPVVKDNKIVGIVTRTDVLKKVHSSLFPSVKPGKNGIPDLARKMKDSLPEKFISFIKEIGEKADSMGMRAFLIGGFVRDILLGGRNYDLDIVVEGDAILFGKALAKKTGGTLVVHKKFGTATIVNDCPEWLRSHARHENKFKIDIATARKEVYEKPAALPTVEFSSLRDDLYRRDFTINAMGAGINPGNFGMFFDFFGGIKDLKKGVIRVLHDKSFIDDPTRIFRAVRFEQRFGFQIEKHTEYLIKHAVKKEMFQWTENQRIRDELKLILREKDPEKAVFRMRELHELRFIHPELVLRRTLKRDFAALRRVAEWYKANAAGRRPLDMWLMYFMFMLDRLTLSQVEEVLKKFIFTRSESIRLLSYRKHSYRARRALNSKNRVRPSGIYDILEPLSHEVSLCILAKTRSAKARNRIKKFFTDYNGIKLLIKGIDIQKEGINPGPFYRKILRAVLREKLDGGISTKKDEIACMRQLINAAKAAVKNGSRAGRYG